MKKLVKVMYRIENNETPHLGCLFQFSSHENPFFLSFCPFIPPRLRMVKLHYCVSIYCRMLNIFYNHRFKKMKMKTVMSVNCGKTRISF